MQFYSVFRKKVSYLVLLNVVIFERNSVGWFYLTYFFKNWGATTIRDDSNDYAVLWDRLGSGTVNYILPAHRATVKCSTAGDCVTSVKRYCR